MKKITLLLFLFFVFIANTLQAQAPPPPTGYQANITLCEGQTLNLTGPNSFEDKVIVAYRWFHGPPFTTISTLQNPSFPNMTTALAGDYAVEFIYQDGSTNAAPFVYNVIVNSRPATPTAANNTPICSGSPLSLTTPSVSGASYHWTGPNGFTSTLQNPGIPTATAGYTGTYTVTTALNGCSSLPATTTATVNQQTSHTTTATAVGSYVWAVNGQTYTATGTHTVVSGCHTETLDLTINGAAISTQPAGAIICSTAGSTASFTVSATMPNAVYSWQYRKVTTAIPNPAWIPITSSNAGTVYSGYASATLGVTKTASLPAVGTEYRVVISGDVPALTSDTATITILSTAKAGVVASAVSVCLGSNITFTAAKYSGTSLQWQSALVASGTFANIPGATGTTYTVSDATSGMDKAYRVVVSCSCDGSTVASGAKTIKVDPVSVAGSITGGGIVCSGSNATIKTAGYVGKIQWEYSTDGTNYVNAPKAADAQTVPFGTSSANSTGGSYMVTGILADVYFRAKITSGSCSSDYTASVHYTIGTDAVVGTASTASAMVCPATSTTLTLSDATGVITWQKSTNYNSATPTWTNIANSNDLSVSSGNIAYNTAFRAKVSIGECSTVYSDLVYVSVVAKPVAKPLMKSVTTPTGNTATTQLCRSSNSKVLTVGVGTIGDIQWQRSTTSTTAGFSDISGANSPSYTIMYANTAVGANYYRVRLTNSCGVEVFGAATTVYFKSCPGDGDASGGDIVKMARPFSVTAYPNPYRENFSLNLSTSSEETVGVMVYDMTGKMVEKLEVNPSNSTDLKLGNNYPSGIYNVVVTQGSDLKTLRVVK